MASTPNQPILPSETEMAQAQACLKFLRQNRSERSFSIRSPSGLMVPISKLAFSLLNDVLVELSRGNAVSVISFSTELSTQEAADLLNVSRPHLIKLLDENKIPHFKVGSHRRILFKDLIEFQQRRSSGIALQKEQS